MSSSQESDWPRRGCPSSLLIEEGMSLIMVLANLWVTPLFDLRQRGKDLHSYVKKLEEVILRTLRDFSIDGDRDECHPGVWVNEQEIAAIGLSLRNWVSMHGFALNINIDLEHFSFINPCGFSDRRATSMSKILGSQIPMQEARNSLISHFCNVFD